MWILIQIKPYLSMTLMPGIDEALKEVSDHVGHEIYMFPSCMT